MTVFYRVIQVYLIALLCSASTSIWAQDCSSTDDRPEIEQLDCFCNSADQSPIQQKVEKIGQLAEKFGLVNSISCPSAISHLLAFSEDAAIERNVTSRLSALGFAGTQLTATLSEANQAKELAESVLSKDRMFGHSSSSSFNLSIGKQGITFEITNNGDSASSVDDHLNITMLQKYKMTLEVQINGVSVSSVPFAGLFQKVERAVEIGSNYPAEHVISCLQVTSDLEIIYNCLDSPASSEKIAACIAIKMSTTNTFQCLTTPAEIDQLQACGELNMLSSHTLECLNQGVSPETIKACGRLNMIASNTNNCISSGASADKIDACGRLNMISSKTLACIYSNAKTDVIDACRNWEFKKVCV